MLNFAQKAKLFIMIDKEKALKEHREGIKDWLRKRRSDAGIKREHYKTILPQKYRNCLYRANASKMDFDITVEEFDHILSLPCTYCGSESKVSVDRIDSYQGYITGNVQPACAACNLMKHCYKPDEFIGMIKKIYRHLNLGS